MFHPILKKTVKEPQGSEGPLLNCKVPLLGYSLKQGCILSMKNLMSPLERRNFIRITYELQDSVRTRKARLCRIIIVYVGVIVFTLLLHLVYILDSVVVTLLFE